MSVKALTWAFGQPLTGWPSEKLVLLALADHADTDGECWPSFRRIAERASLSEATVKRAMKWLRLWGLVEREERAGKDGRQTSNFYRLRFDIELAEPPSGEGVSVRPLDETESESESRTGACEDVGVEGAQPDTGGSRTAPPPLSQSATPGEGQPATPYRNRQSEPVTGNTPNPQGGNGAEENLEGEGTRTRAPTHAMFFKRYDQPTASKALSEAAWSELNDKRRRRAYGTIDAHRRACEAEQRKRCDPARFLKRRLFENFEPERVEAEKSLPNFEHRETIVEFDWKMVKAPMSGEPGWVFVAHGSTAWNHWQAALRLAGCTPVRAWHYEARPFAGRPEPLHGRYFPVALPPSAPPELLALTGDDLARVLTEPAPRGQHDAEADGE